MYYPICARMCEAFSISSFRHITLPHPSFSLTITATKSLATLQFSYGEESTGIYKLGERHIIYATFQKFAVGKFLAPRLCFFHQKSIKNLIRT